MGSRKGVRVVLGLCAGLACLVPAHAATKPNVVFVLIDALRADSIAGTRNGVPLMPYLNGLSAVRFENATTPASWTLPAMVSLFTSQFVDTHGVFAQGASLPANIQSMAAWFKEAGYTTIGIQTNGNLSGQRGFSQGFDQYEDMINTVAETVTTHALAATQSVSEPFLLYTHYLDPHMPYDPPQSYRTLVGYPDPGLPQSDQAILDNFLNGYFWDYLNYLMGVRPTPPQPELTALGKDSLRVRYDGETRYTDDQVRSLLDNLLGRFPNTIVVVLADHGDHFWEHRFIGHEVTVYEPLMHVPLIIKAPGLTPGAVTDVVDTVDVLPTLAGLIGLPAPRAWQGRSLFAARDPQGPVFSCAKAGQDYHLDLHMIRQGSMKLICNRGTGALELYNLAPDPGETINLAQQQPALSRQMLDTLNIHLRENARRRGSGGIVLWAEWPGGLLEEGHPIRFVAPEGVGYVWFKDGQPLHDSPPRLAGTDTQSLFIAAAATEDSGGYECMYSDADQNLRITEQDLVTVVPVDSVPVFGVGTAAALVVFFAGLGCMLLREKRGQTRLRCAPLGSVPVFRKH